MILTIVLLLFILFFCIYLYSKPENYGVFKDPRSFEDSLTIFGLKDDSTLTPELIKKTYRNLSIKYHPDKNPGISQEEEYGKQDAGDFIRLNYAYKMLLDREKAEYEALQFKVDEIDGKTKVGELNSMLQTLIQFKERILNSSSENKLEYEEFANNALQKTFILLYGKIIDEININININLINKFSAKSKHTYKSEYEKELNKLLQLKSTFDLLLSIKVNFPKDIMNTINTNINISIINVKESIEKIKESIKKDLYGFIGTILFYTIIFSISYYFSRSSTVKIQQRKRR
jgi:curved DNA-binding protein CbpA